MSENNWMPLIMIYSNFIICAVSGTFQLFPMALKIYGPSLGIIMLAFSGLHSFILSGIVLFLAI